MSLVVANGLGTITVPEHTLLDLVATAGNGVRGARVRRKRSISPDARVVRLEIAVLRRENVRETALGVQEAVADALRTMCGVAATVEVAVEERV